MTAAADRITARRAATRDAILDAAWALARSEGLGGIGMRTLASRVGMTASSLYEYFDGKDAIYDAMFVQGNRQLMARYAGWDDPGDVRRGLVAGIAGLEEEELHGAQRIAGGSARAKL